MTVKKRIVAQFKQSHGLLGHVAGLIMANRPSKIERNEWAIELLDLKPGDHLLEIGFGPGVAIASGSNKITNGLIVGIDHLHTMLQQATKRNAAAIRQGIVRLYPGSTDKLPAFDQPFDKIFSANVVQFWEDPVSVFTKLHSLLAPHGVIATAYMPRHRNATDADAPLKAAVITNHLKSAGFSKIRAEEKRTKPVSVVCVVATNKSLYSKEELRIIPPLPFPWS